MMGDMTVLPMPLLPLITPETGETNRGGVLGVI
jgi:hypothetical protein